MSFVIDRDEYSALLAEIGEAVQPTLRLPKQVLRSGSPTTLFFEFEEIFEAPLWRAVRELATDLRDAELLGVVIEPDPVQYFLKEFGYYGAFRASVGKLEQEVPEILALEPPQSAADSLVSNGRTLAFVTSSKSIAIWAERELGIGLLQLHVPAATLSQLPRHVRWFGISEALELMAPSFIHRVVPAEFTREFRAAYSR